MLFNADFLSDSFFNDQSTSAAVVVLFACGPVLFWFHRLSMLFDPPAGLYCCLRARRMPFISCKMAAWVYCLLSLRWKFNHPISAMIDRLVEVCAVKHESVMFFCRKEVVN